MEKYCFYGSEYANIHNGLNISVNDLYVILRSIWCKYTCAPRMRKDWNPCTPSIGQCSITAFLFQDYFGGKVYGIPLGDGHFHCYNIFEGYIFDLTSEQFGETVLSYSQNDPEQHRLDHFANEEKKRRYDYLCRAMHEELCRRRQIS